MKMFKNNVEVLKKQSSESISIFNQTINKLKQINDQIETLVSRKKDSIIRLEDEISELDTQADSNYSIISKIEKIIS